MYTYHVYANDSLSGPTLHNRTGQKSEPSLHSVIFLCKYIFLMDLYFVWREMTPTYPPQPKRDIYTLHHQHAATQHRQHAYCPHRRCKFNDYSSWRQLHSTVTIRCSCRSCKSQWSQLLKTVLRRYPPTLKPERKCLKREYLPSAPAGISMELSACREDNVHILIDPEDSSMEPSACRFRGSVSRNRDFDPFYLPFVWRDSASALFEEQILGASRCSLAKKQTFDSLDMLTQSKDLHWAAQATFVCWSNPNKIKSPQEINLNI